MQSRFIRQVASLCAGWLLVFSCANATPVLFSYWAGWANAPIPSFSFNGLDLAFGIMQKNGSTFSTSYKASGNFANPAATGPYVTWITWVKKYYAQGARSYVSYGGSSNDDFRGYVINGSAADLSNMAGAIQSDVKKYYFNGVDLDIENWWGFNNSQNVNFADNLITLVEDLRQALDADQSTFGTPISISVGWNSAGPVDGMNDGGSDYTGTMTDFFSNSVAMQDIATVNIMSYNTGISNFYSQFDLVGNILNKFVSAGVPKEKLLFGVQPYESSGQPATSLATVSALGNYIQENNYGGMFMWGIGTNGIGSLSSYDYLQAMKTGLGLP